MDWVLREIDIKGDAGFLNELESIIDNNKPAAGIWIRTGHITDILGDLHLILGLLRISLTFSKELSRIKYPVSIIDFSTIFSQRIRWKH